VSAFVTANGGTTASAYLALLAGIASGNAYFNVHTITNQNGDISGFYQKGQVPVTASYNALLTPVVGEPMLDVSASGSASVSTQTSLTGSISLTAVVTVQGISSGINAAHIHCCTSAPYTGTTGPALVKHENMNT
jgi:hypothetical protein